MGGGVQYFAVLLYGLNERRFGSCVSIQRTRPSRLTSPYPGRLRGLDDGRRSQMRATIN